MHIQKVRVEGFRLLQDVEILLENGSTVIVGRNNSGKTSFTDVLDRFVGDSGAKFRLEDFSAENRDNFYTAKELRDAGAKAYEILAALPKITLTLTFSYERDVPSLGPLSPFVIDLDTNSTIAIVRLTYTPTNATIGKLLDTSVAPEGVDPRVHFFKSIRENIHKSYSIHVSAIDPTDNSNIRDFDNISAVSSLIQCNFIRAQRTLDHAKNGDANAIGKLLGSLFKAASSQNSADGDQQLASQLKMSVENIERNIQNDFDGMLRQLLPAIGVLGFPALNDTEIMPETSLNVESLLSDHTKIVYAGLDGIHLPEGYNGLGTRNLIYMLLQLESYYKDYRAKEIRPVTHLIFIEEPEAHLHPQMQEVFVNKINLAIRYLSARYPNEPLWKVQFVITTHSPHVANAASFEAVRYFLNEYVAPGGLRSTKVKDFRKGMAVISNADQDFLHQYMTLTKCDLYFADKAVLIEGTTERLLMPRLVELADENLDESNKLSSQYLTCIEVGGAYAHIFYPLLDFLELKALIITDLDSIKPVEKQNKHGKTVTVWEKCLVEEGVTTSNAAIKSWFRTEKDDGIKQITLAELIAKTDADKIIKHRRITYQIPELGSKVCARSYEDALILANLALFEIADDQDKATNAWDIAQNLGKADTALRFAIKERGWRAPLYILEGLRWLAELPKILPIENPNVVDVEGAKHE